MLKDNQVKDLQLEVVRLQADHNRELESLLSQSAREAAEQKMNWE